MVTISKLLLEVASERAQSATVALVCLGCLSCATPLQPTVAPPATITPAPLLAVHVAPTPSPHLESQAPLTPSLEAARFAFQGAALERIGERGRTVWRTELAAEKHRQLAVLGNTVLVWGSSQQMQRFDAETGAPKGAPTPLAEVSLFVVHHDVLVQSTSRGLIATDEQTTLWRRPELVSDSLVVGATEQQPVVLLVTRTDGRPVALNLRDGREADYPLPSGVFERVTLEPDSDVIGWRPKDGGPITYCQAEDGTPL